MKTHARPLFTLLTAVALAVGSLSSGCGGSDESPSVDPFVEPVVVTLAYKQGDLLTTDQRLKQATAAVGITSGALLQAIFAVNSFVFTDPKVTNYPTYLQRHVDAQRALSVLALSAGKTEQYAEALPSTEAGVMPLQASQRVKFPMAASSEEVLAVLNSSKSKWPIITLMQQYRVSAPKAQLILNNAMAGLTSQAYLEEAFVATQVITRLELVKSAAALTVVVGGTVASMGTAAALGTTLSGFQVGSAVIGTADAVIKVTKAGAELAIGRDGALDSAFEKSMLVNTISDVNELVSVFGLFTPSGDGLDATNKLIWLGGKLSEVFQENKVSFGAGSLTLTKFDDDFKAAYLARVKALKYPTTFPGSYLDAAQLPVTVVAGDMPPVVAIVLAALPVSDRLATVQKLISDTQIVAPPVLGFDGSYKGLSRRLACHRSIPVAGAPTVSRSPFQARLWVET